MARDARLQTLGAALLFAALTALLFASLLRCPTRCQVDHRALHGGAIAGVEQDDVRLNAWILAWVQHALATDPGSLLDGNIFYPSRGALLQSEHILAAAVLTAPLRLFTDEPLAIHHAASMLSSWLLALTTWAFVRWLTGSFAAALLAGGSAMLLPWRLMELSHVQLLSAQWFPLAWLASGRILLGEARRRDVLWLLAALLLQVLSSFYLAYHLLLSLALWCGVLAAHAGISARRLAALALAGAPAAVALLAAGLPYLHWKQAVGFHGPRVEESYGPGTVIGMLLPDPQAMGLVRLPIEMSMSLPLGVLVLAGIGIAACARRGPLRLRAGTRALLGVALAALVLSLGRELAIGDHRVPLPGALAAALVPGYDTLRNPLRWAVLIGLVSVPLAGVGVAALENAGRRLRGAAGVATARSVALLGLAATLPLLRLPVRDAYDGVLAHPAVYDALAERPAAPVLEIPWPLEPKRGTAYVTRYMLASTRHWRPLLNGSSGYAPPTTILLRQLVQRLPEPDALARLASLVDLRWIVVHQGELGPASRRAWERSVSTGALTRVYEDEHAWILELAGASPPAAVLEALRENTRGPRTLTGLSREPLASGRRAGTLSVARVRPFYLLGRLPAPQLLQLVVTNTSRQPWASLDPFPHGLVLLRARFFDAEGRVGTEALVPLTEDVPPGTRLRVGVPVLPPDAPGTYRLHLELVQQQDDAVVPLAVPAFERRVEVRSVDPETFHDPDDDADER